MNAAAETAAPPTLQISRRADRLKPSATLAAAAKVKALQAAGRIVHDFTTGEPDFDTPLFIKEAAIQALAGGMTKYQPVPGPLDARQAIAAKLARENGITCTPEQIVITSGGKAAVYLALQALVDEGDEVIIPTPAWVSYRPMVELCGGRAIEVPGSARNDFKITPEQLAGAITPRTRFDHQQPFQSLWHDVCAG